MAIRSPELRKTGFFITVEGPEGAGKSSCSAALAKFFEQRSIPVIRTREPGGTPLAEKLREVVKSKPDQNEFVHPETELLLMEAARAQHVRTLIIPALQQGKTVICDRFSDSTCAYQGGARGMDMAAIEWLNNFASPCKPDLTILLDLPVEAGFDRVFKRQSDDAANDRFEAEALDFHRKVRTEFLKLAAAEPGRIKVVDASRTLDEVLADVEQIANELIR